MNRSQKLLCLVFVFSYISETALTCVALDSLISDLGSGSLIFYYSLSSAVSIVSILFFLLISKKATALRRFFGIHLLLGVLAALCLAMPSLESQSRVLFIAIIGFNLLLYFSHWSLATLFISPFESKRLFPRLGAAGKIGAFLGGMLAMAAPLGIERRGYLLYWLLTKILLIGLGIFLAVGRRSDVARGVVRTSEGPKPSLFQMLRHYRLVPRLTVWVFLWGILLTVMESKVGATFERSGVQLTHLYGALALCMAGLSSLFSFWAFPRLVRWLSLGPILFAASLLSSMAGGGYLFFDLFVIAVLIDLLFDLLDGNVVGLSISVEFGLYPYSFRDQLRLVGEILAQSVGSVLAVLVFALSKAYGSWVIGSLFLILTAMGWALHRGFAQEVLDLLKSDDLEEQENAIALFDQLERRENYDQMMKILAEGGELSARIGVLQTFAWLRTLKPASAVLRILETCRQDPLKLATLHYLGQVDFRKLDPFLQYRFLESLQTIFQSAGSDSVRSMAVKLWVQHGSIDKTVPVILSGLADKDGRVAANVIDGLGALNYPGVVDLLLPLLAHPLPRVRANCIVTLWRHPEARDETQRILEQMLLSDDVKDRASGIWAAGEVRAAGQMPLLLKMAEEGEKEILRILPVTLLKLGRMECAGRIVDLILGEDEKQAVNVCYLTLRFEKSLLNEKIIALIFERGLKARNLAARRYGRCGGFCREQILLLKRQQQAGVAIPRGF